MNGWLLFADVLCCLLHKDVCVVCTFKWFSFCYFFRNKSRLCCVRALLGPSRWGRCIVLSLAGPADDGPQLCRAWTTRHEFSIQMRFDANKSSFQNRAHAPARQPLKIMWTAPMSSGTNRMSCCYACCTTTNNNNHNNHKKTIHSIQLMRRTITYLAVRVKAHFVLDHNHYKMTSRILRAKTFLVKFQNLRPSLSTLSDWCIA